MKLEKLFVSILAAAALFVGCKDNGENSELPALSVNPTEITIDKAGGSQTITVKSNRDWTVKTDADWLAPTPTSGNASKKDATVSVKALANTGYNRTGTVTVSTEFDYKTVTVIQPGDKGEDNTNKPSGSGTQADPYNVAAAIAAVKDLTWTSNDSYEKTGPYFVKGKISQIGKDSKTGEDLTYTQSGTYSNATFYISDDGSTGNEFYCYRVSYLGNKKFITGQTDIKVGDEVVIYGELMNYRGNTPETVQGSAYLYSLNGETQGQGGEEGKPSGSGTQADPYNVAAAIAAVKDLTWTSNDSYEKTGPYFVKGKISQIGKDSKTGEDLTYTQSGTYSNATFYISDDGSTGNEFYCYRVSYLGNKKFITGQTDIKVGDEVVIYGELMNYRGNTPETVQGSAYLYSLNGETQGQGGDEVQEVTVAQAIAAQKDALLKVGPALVIASSQAGFLIEQDGARLYVYGKTANVGDNVTVTATRGEYSKVAQLTDVTEIITNSTGNAVTHPTPKDITSTFDSYSSDTREYVTFKGTLSISGNYFNIAVEGASTYTGALVKPNEDVSSFNGKVVTVTGYYLYIASSKYLYIIATEIKSDGESPGGDEAKEVTVAQALAAEKDELLKVGPALVIASSQAGFLMEQDGAMIYVYGSTAKVGDNVTVTATRGEYSGVAQLTNATAVVTNSTGNTVTYPSPKDITSTFDSYSSTTHEYVTFKGTLSISSGKYFNIAVEGASTLTGSIVTPNQDISALNGKVVSITGYFLYIASSKYLYVIATEIKDEGGETPPGPGGDEDFSSNVTWTLGSNAKTEEATVNGKSAVQVLKIGTSSKVGTATVVIPKGTKSVSFYGVSWKGKPASVQVLFGETPLYTQELAANEGAANSSPYTITVKDSDHYSMALPETLTEDVSVTVTTTGTNTRVILFGIKAEK